MHYSQRQTVCSFVLEIKTVLQVSFFSPSTAAICTYTYISHNPTKYTYRFINSHLFLTVHIRDYALASYLQLTSSCYCTSEQCILHHRQSSFLPRSRLGRRMYGHRPIPYGLLTALSLPVLLPNITAAICHGYTYISLAPNKLAYGLINSHLFLTRDYALASYLHAG